MKRQRGRNRGGGGNNRPQQHNANRAFDSNGPDGVKVRGAAQSVFEKYQQLARDAASSGDRVLAENYLQHAEHYFRVLRAVQPNRPVAEIIGRDQFSSGFDIDFEAEPEEIETPEPVAVEEGEAQPRADQQQQRGEWRDRPREDRRPRDDRPREDRNREDRFRDDRPRDQRDDRARDDRPREDRQRFDRRDERSREERSRDDRPREDRARDDRPREERQRDRWRERDERRERGEDPLAVVEPRGGALTSAEARAPEPVREAEPAPTPRAQDNFEDQMPAFLGGGRAASPAGEESLEAEAPKRPRRRRTTRAAEEGEAAPVANPAAEEA